MGTRGAVTFDLPTDGAAHVGTGTEGSAVPATAQWDGEALVLTIAAEPNHGPMGVVDDLTVQGDTLRSSAPSRSPGSQASPNHWCCIAGTDRGRLARVGVVDQVAGCPPDAG